MPIEKLEEFAKDGQRNTDDLSLTDGFPVIKKPARQWFNWLFYELTRKINEIIDAGFLQSTDIIDNLTTAESQKALSANMGKKLQDDKLGKTENAVSASKLETARTISFSGAATGSASFDGSSNVSAVLTLANSGVAALTYGSNLKIPVITVNAKGLITGVSEKTIPEVVEATTTVKGIIRIATEDEWKSGSDVVAVVTPNMIQRTGLGSVGQKKYEMKSQRAWGVTYTNTTGRPITFRVKSNQGSIIKQYVDDDAQIVTSTDLFIVPPNSTYKATNDLSTATIGSWEEYR